MAQITTSALYDFSHLGLWLMYMHEAGGPGHIPLLFFMHELGTPKVINVSTGTISVSHLSYPRAQGAIEEKFGFMI